MFITDVYFALPDDTLFIRQAEPLQRRTIDHIENHLKNSTTCQCEKEAPNLFDEKSYTR